MDVSPSEVKAVRPVINSVSFHRYGKEFSITITGENLWFCYEVKVGALRQVVSAKSTTQKCLQFNLNIEDHQQFPGTADRISVKVWSHFMSPVTNDKTEVKHKVRTTIVGYVIIGFYFSPEGIPLYPPAHWLRRHVSL